MRKRKILENIIIITFFLAVMAFPWTAYFLGVENNLQGADEKVELSFEKLDDYIIQNFPGREILMRSKNQFMYSFFDTSPNGSIIKVNDTLFSTEALNYYYHNLYNLEPKEVDELIEKFKLLDSILKEKDKKLVITITPTKARFYDGPLPFADDVILAYQEKKSERPYDDFKDKLAVSGLNYFDCIDYIYKHKETIVDGEVPLFYDSGHHWSTYKGNLVGLAFLTYLRDKLDLIMPDLKIVSTPSDVPLYPDADLFTVLNIYDKPKEQFYGSEVIFEKYNLENYNYLVQGGSFLGALLMPHITLGYDNNVVHIENKACFTDNYKNTTLFETYDELNGKIGLLDMMKDFDVMIFEINELNVYNATFGFLDYILEHREYL